MIILLLVIAISITIMMYSLLVMSSRCSRAEEKREAENGRARED